MRHTWTTDDDLALKSAVETVMASPLHRSRKLWAAVAGRMLPTEVTPDACRSRWQRLSAMATDAGVTHDGWQDAVARVEQYEADTQDAILEAIRGLRDEQAAMSIRLAQMERDLRRLTEMWQ